MNWLPLLSKKPLGEFTAEEYKTYVKALNWDPPKRKSPPKKKKPPAPFKWSINKKGVFTLKVNRRPKWLSREEIDQIAKDSGLPLATVWNKVTAKKSGIQISTEEEQLRISESIREIPF